MNRSEVIALKQAYFEKEAPYVCRYWRGWKYQTLQKCSRSRRSGRGENTSYSDCFIMADTETSKARPNTINKKTSGVEYVPIRNHVVAWTISIRNCNCNLVTLYGFKPSEMMYCINLIIENLQCEHVIIYFHNLAYDWVFLRQFFIDSFNYPTKQLATKPHYPIVISFENGLILKDSLILSQRSLEKWANDMNVEHKKAVGKWDYDKIRNQKDMQLSSEELEYIEHDTLSGVECLNALADILHKTVMTMPYTATGIPREETRKRGKSEHAKQSYNKQVLQFYQQAIAERVFHGGFTHGNRHLIGNTITGITRCYDFASSYPYVMLAYKYPCEAFHTLPKCSINDILAKSEGYAFMFKLILFRPILKDRMFPMPALQHSKCVKVINPILDNGRLLGADYVEIFINEIDAEVINNQYEFEKHVCTEVHYARKDYLPRWFTDYIFELFTDKCKLKGVDKVRYALQKATLNSCYGMTVQRPVKPDITEDYGTGEYNVQQRSLEAEKEAYEKKIKQNNTILPFQWGCWVTSYAFRNLFNLIKCAGTPIYTDTDSCYGQNWNTEAVAAYNENCKRLLQNNGYGSVTVNGREYWLGVAESAGAEDEYTEFRVLGAKRYCGRCRADGELHITVAGVPKRGSKCLNDNIENFHAGFVFDGITTNKKTHTYMFENRIFIDENGNEVADSIDLTPCDYQLDSVLNIENWEDLLSEDVYISIYEESEGAENELLL